jgi:hypothetical protein
MIASVDPERSAAYELAYQEGVRALDEQRIVIDAFRTRAGLLLSAAAIATSFLGGAALQGDTSILTWTPPSERITSRHGDRAQARWITSPCTGAAAAGTLAAEPDEPGDTRRLGRRIALSAVCGRAISTETP